MNRIPVFVLPGKLPFELNALDGVDEKVWASLGERNEPINAFGASADEIRFIGGSFRESDDIRLARFKKCTFRNVDFDTRLIETTFKECAFENCYFRSRSSPCDYTRFLDCSFLKTIPPMGRDLDLSGSTGLIDPSDWMENHFISDKHGYLVFKRIGAKGSTEYNAPSNWKIEPGSFISEQANSNRSEDCGCGVNFATAKWILNIHLRATPWLCRIRWRDLPSVVVPYGAEGKARCQTLQVVEPLTAALLAHHVEVERQHITQWRKDRWPL